MLPIVFRAQEGFRNDLDDLGSMTIYSSARGERVPLAQIASIRGEIEPSLVRRVDQQRGVSGRFGSR